MKPGIYKDLPIEEYFKIKAINKSSLDYLDQTPLHYYAHCVDPNRESEEATDAMRLGTAVHMAILEPKRFSESYAHEPEDAPRRPSVTQLNAKKPSDDTIALIDYWKRFDESVLGKQVLSFEDYKRCLAISDAARRAAVTEALFAEGSAEATIVWEDIGTGLLCKARADWLCEDAILDFKTTDDASPYQFARKIADYGWHRQAAWYLDGFEVVTGKKTQFIFGALEKSPPYATAYYFASEEMISIGRQENAKRLETVAQCMKSNTWPGYSDLVEAISLPKWKTNQYYDAQS